MTAVELVKILAEFESVSIRQQPTVVPYKVTGGGYGGQVDPYSTTFRFVGIHMHRGVCIGQAATLSAALEEALGKAGE